MKKSFVLILGISLIFFVTGLFVEVKADMTPEEINNLLKEKGCTVEWLLTNYGGEAKGYGLPDMYYGEYQASSNDPVHNNYYGFVNAIWNAALVDLEAVNYNTDFANTNSKDLIFTYNGLTQFFGEMTDQVIQDLETSASTSTSASAHSFTIQTNSYNGSQYRVIGKNNNPPVFQKKVGSDWVDLNY